MPMVIVCRRQGIADGEHVVAHLHLIGIANGDGLQGAGVHLEYGNVGLGIGATT